MKCATRHSLIFRGAVIVLLVSIARVDRAKADALVVTKAMLASTIAEVFVEESQIRVEIEVGTNDLSAFANILPDELYERLTGSEEPLVQRVQEFLDQDWVMEADGQPLRGTLQRALPAKRIVRDEVTGQPLAEQPADAELVIRLTLNYELHNRPTTLIIRPPPDGDGVAASIGFVCYHIEIPVNDFRYLPTEATLDLDWNDPWYSRFRHPNLRRQFDAPLSAYLYIEPYEVRKEIIVRPRDLNTWVDLPLSDDGVIRIDQQEALKKQIATFLSEKNPVVIDGQLAQGRLDRIHFIHRTLRTTGIVEPPVELDANSATLGVIFVYPIDHLPQEVSMRWELFSQKIPSVPAVAADETGGLPSRVTPDDPVLIWKNYLTNPTNPRMMPVARPPASGQFTIPVLSLFCVGIALALAGWQWSQGKGFSRFGLAATFAAIAIAVVSIPFAKVTIANPLEEPTGLSDQAAQGILSSLLYNVYRSFDHHDESLIYDRLAKSISGELLSDVYLETRKSMEVKNQGGLRISVKEVTVTELELPDDNAAERTFRCRWRVSGWIGHWGHTHRRENEHIANITLAPHDGAWKITDMEMLDEQPAESSPETISRQDAAP